MKELEKYFLKYRNKILGIEQKFNTPYGEKKIIYADWIASGRLYKDIEERMLNNFAPFIGNTHSESSITGKLMTYSYHKAHYIIKKHVNANDNDIIITAGFGMTAVINKLQRILGLKVPEQFNDCITFKENEKPIVFITHMEHHSNQTSWLETLADVVVIEPDETGLVSLSHLEELLEKYKNRTRKIGSFTAASNVTGIKTEYHKMAKLMHRYGGLCFVDFAASAPYVNINMHPEDPEEKLDAIFFSPHKFLGGPGTSGVLIFDKMLYNRKIPDHPGGGTVDWTNPWGERKYVDNIEAREDGGTPGFLQAIRTSLCIKLKEEMTTEKILSREEELLNITFDEFSKIDKIHILANDSKERIGAISFYVEDIHYNLIVKLLNDRYGVQVRGGCSCAGTYGHYLLHVDPTRSHRITEKISHGDLSEKPGWVRMSLHPTMTNEELYTITNALKEITKNIEDWRKDYNYDIHTNEFYHKNEIPLIDKVKDWFNN